MIIDTQTSVTILFAVLIGSCSAALVVHTTKDISKKSCYIAITGITILLILIILLLRFWNIAIEHLLALLVFAETSVQILLAKLTPMLENLANTVGPYLLIIIDLVTWLILFTELKQLNNKHNVLDSVVNKRVI